MSKVVAHARLGLLCKLIGAFHLSVTLITGSCFAASKPELPRVFLDTKYVPPSGREIAVASGGDFQAALNRARPGDLITLEAGASFVGNFTLRKKSGTGWITIRSSALKSLPPPGTRVNPLHASLMPKIVSPNHLPAIRTEAAAHHYRFVGVEITTTHAETTSTNHRLIELEAAGGQASLSQVPSDIVFDRCYIHGTATGNVRRGIAMNSARTAVIDSYLSDFHEVGAADSQAIAGWNGPGPFKIVNNYLEGAGENVVFGGTDPSIPDLVPSDIEIRRNHFFKPLSWKIGDPSFAGIPWTVKYLFELKNARRVLVEGNLFEHNWVHGFYAGTAIAFHGGNQDGTAAWSVVEDVTFTKNIIRHANNSVSILGTDYNHPSQRAKRILIRDNLIELDASRYGSKGCNGMFSLGNIASPNSSMPGGILDLTIEHNTGRISGICTAALGMGDSTADFNKHENFVFQNNLVESGVSGSGTGEGTGTLNTYTKPGYIFVKNVLIGRPSHLYPPHNFFPASPDAVGFVNHAAGDYRLAASSPYKRAGTGSKDPGADFAALCAAVAGILPTGEARQLSEARASVSQKAESPRPPSGRSSSVKQYDGVITSSCRPYRDAPLRSR